MADVGTADLSSYAKNSLAGQDPNAMIKSYQEVERNQLGIDSQKLSLINNQMTLLGNGLGALASDPNLTRDKVLNSVQNWVKLGIIPANKAAQEISQLPTDPAAMMQYIKEHQLRVVGAQSQINQLYGQPQLVNRGPDLVPMQVGAMGTRQLGAPIQLGQTPEGLASPQTVQTPTGQVLQTDSAGRQQMLGRNPLLGSQVAPVGSAVQGGANALVPKTPAAALGVAAIPAPSPLFEEGKKQYTADQELATANAQPIRALQSAIPIIKSLNKSGMGPNVQGYQDAVALAKRLGVIDANADPKQDPQALYQQMSKYLLQASEAAGASRSDLDAYNKKAANANPEQLLGAALELSENSLANRMLDSMRAASFKDQDYSKYGKHRSEFSQNQDLKALRIINMEPPDRSKLVGEMAEKLKRGDKEAKKFFQTLRNAREAGFL